MRKRGGDKREREEKIWEKEKNFLFNKGTSFLFFFAKREQVSVYFFLLLLVSQLPVIPWQPVDAQNVRIAPVPVLELGLCTMRR